MTEDRKPKRKYIPFRVRARLQKEIKSKCPFCSDEDVEHFEFHHIDDDRSNNSALNLIMVCRKCHSKITNGVIGKDVVIKVKERLILKAQKTIQNFVKVEVESEFPGGIMAWQHFLNSNLRYPKNAIEKEIQGKVVVQFIVDPEGRLSSIEAISGPQELRDEAIRVIQLSGRWLPANQNGRYVKSYQKQPIVFKLEETLLTKFPSLLKKLFS